VNPTIKDIAREADVSYATVSRALNNKYGVKPATKARISDIAKRLRYSPNAIARGLVMRQTHTLGLILPDITNPFFPEVARGVEDFAQENGYSVFLCNTNWERRRESDYVGLLAEKRADGLIIAPVSSNAEALEREFPRDMPVVYVSSVPTGTRRSCVAIDNIRGGHLATTHLIENGYRRLGFIGAMEESQAVDERLEGFRRAHREAGRALSEQFVHLGHFRRETGYDVMRKMIDSDDYPDAVFAENDIIALGVIQAVRDAGLAVPGDVAVVGFDDIQLAAYREIGLSTVYQPKYEMGRMASGVLLEGILGPEVETDAGGADLDQQDAVNDTPKTGRRIILEPQLIVRNTSGPKQPAGELS
jgi:LacI family transcriptional regulator, galactose operon repressor